MNRSLPGPTCHSGYDDRSRVGGRGKGARGRQLHANHSSQSPMDEVSAVYYEYRTILCSQQEVYLLNEVVFAFCYDSPFFMKQPCWEMTNSEQLRTED